MSFSLESVGSDRPKERLSKGSKGSKLGWAVEFVLQAPLSATHVARLDGFRGTCATPKKSDS